MLSKNDAAIIYETLLASPGMNDEVKINLQIPRKNVLILNKVIELGLSLKNANELDGLFNVINGKTLEDIKAVSIDILEKAGLTEVYEKLNSLQSK
jgi:hypothetical protein